MTVVSEGVEDNPVNENENDKNLSSGDDSDDDSGISSGDNSDDDPTDEVFVDATDEAYVNASENENNNQSIHIKDDDIGPEEEVNDAETEGLGNDDGNERVASDTPEHAVEDNTFEYPPLRRSNCNKLSPSTFTPGL